jgi:hypothetical protein
VGSLGLRNFIMWHWFASMNNVRELNCVLNEENRNIVADEIEVALRSVELCGKSTNVSYSISRSYTLTC